MKDALASDFPRESYVVEIDGIPEFEFSVFAQALSASFASSNTIFPFAP